MRKKMKGCQIHLEFNEKGIILGSFVFLTNILRKKVAIFNKLRN